MPRVNYEVDPKGSGRRPDVERDEAAIGSKATDAISGRRADSSRQQGHRQPTNQKGFSCFRGKAVTFFPL